MRRIALPLPWPGVWASVGMFGIPGAESRLSPSMQRVHRSRCARALAVELLDAQDSQAQEIRKGPIGEPIWPAGFVGSLAHTDHYAAAAIASAGSCAALGIDIEPARPLSDDLFGRVLVEAEQCWAESVAATEPAAGRMIACAKQCVHKAIYPLSGAWLDASEVQIEIDLSGGRFSCLPLSDGARAVFAGQRAHGIFQRIEGQLVFVLALMPA